MNTRQLNKAKQCHFREIYRAESYYLEQIHIMLQKKKLTVKTHATYASLRISCKADTQQEKYP